MEDPNISWRFYDDLSEGVDSNSSLHTLLFYLDISLWMLSISDINSSTIMGDCLFLYAGAVEE